MLNPFKLQEMITQASQAQEEMQQKLAQVVVEGQSGGGAVTARMNGKKQLLEVKIDPSAALALTGGQSDVEMLEDLIVSAVNDAGRRAEQAIESNVKSVLGGLNLPGLS